MQRRVHRWSDLLLFGTIPTAFSLSLMKFNFIEDLLMKQFKLLGSFEGFKYWLKNRHAITMV